MANALDEHFEWERLVADCEPTDPLVTAALECLQRATWLDVPRLVASLPALPVVARECVRFLSSHEPLEDELETIATSDGTVARMLVQIAGADP